MKKHHAGVIRIGDNTTHSGVVISGSLTTKLEGRPIARVGDRVTCPKCNGVHTIVEGDDEVKDDGVSVAFHDNKTSCGASLISSYAK